MSFPVWQNGVPQSMQRAPCRRSVSSGTGGVRLLPVLHALLGAAGRRRPRGGTRGIRSACPSSVPAHPDRIPGVLLERGHDGLVLGEPALAHPGLRLEDAAVVVREDADEPRERTPPSPRGSSGRRRSASHAACRRTSSFRMPASAASSTGPRPTSSVLQRVAKSPVSSSTHAMPPDMPAPKFRPVGPRTTTCPPVMYSQPWSPIASTTAETPLFRTQKRSPATPRT